MRFASLKLLLMLGLLAGPVAAQVSSTQIPPNPARICVSQTWARFLTPAPQNPIARETIETEAGMVRVFEFDALKGEFAKLYIFVLFGETCATKAYVIGSYSFTANSGPEGTRVFHADLYTPQAHFTMGFFDGPPAYADIRGDALEALQ